MDYETLYTLLPKEPKKWHVQDVTVWLEYIGLSQLGEKFMAQSIDGSVLDQIEELDLEAELGITQKIVKKKILNWLNVGLKEYTLFIKDIKEKPVPLPAEIINNQVCTLQKEKQPSDFQESLFQNSLKSNNSHNFEPQQNLSLPLTAISNMEEEILIQQQQQKQNMSSSLKFPGNQFEQSQLQKKSENQLILQPLEGQQNNFFCIKESGAKIGRHSKENISRYHAQIAYDLDQRIFNLFDIGSTTGTYIKIQKKMELQVGMFVELGSNLFRVSAIQFNFPTEVEVCLQVEEGPNLNEIFKFTLNTQQPSVTIGRKNTSDLAFPEDHHLSNQHSKFYMVDDKIYIEDFSSTNGTWLRLSPEGKVSQPYPLYPIEQHIIRIGTTNQYLCIQNQVQINSIPETSMCIICCEKERDALFLPCQHNAACLKCSKNFQKCPICRMKISQHIRIYK